MTGGIVGQGYTVVIGYAPITVNAATATAAPFCRWFARLCSPSTAEQPFPPDDRKTRMQGVQQGQRLAGLEPPKCHKLQRRWNHPTHPLHTAEMSLLPVCNNAISAGTGASPA